MLLNVNIFTHLQFLRYSYFDLPSNAVLAFSVKKIFPKMPRQMILGSPFLSTFDSENNMKLSVSIRFSARFRIIPYPIEAPKMP